MGTSHSCETTDDALGRKVLEVMSDHSSHLAVGSSPAVPQDRLVAQMGTEGPLIFQICRDSSAVTVLCVSMTAMFVAISLYKQLIPMLTS